jgi:fermentation-respiration switch protein FrsA (DUF1100 family)
MHAAMSEAEPARRPLRPWPIRLLFSLARIAFGILIGATLLLVFLEKQLIYYPGRVLDDTPKSVDLAFEDVFIDAGDGVKIHGWFIKTTADPMAPTVLFSHGNAGNIANRLDRIAGLRELGANFLLYDYRGYGQSSGEPDEEGTYRDGRAAYDYLVNTRRVDPTRIVLMGESLGCAITLQVALDRKAAGVVLEAPFASIPHMARAIYPFLPVGLFVRTRYDNVDKAARLKAPLFVAQGTLDEIIPIAQGRMVFEAASEPKEFMAIEGAHHNNVYLWGGLRYRRALADFISRTVPARPATGGPPTRQP